MTQAKHDDLTADTIASALHAISPDLARSEWARLGMALKSELGDAEGFDLFDSWSKLGQGYDAKDCRDTWKSIREGGGVNIGTLIYRAQQNGWKFDDERAHLTAEAVEARRVARENERTAAEAERRKAHGEAAERANLAWANATPASDLHPYLQAKRVCAHGLRWGKWPLVGNGSKPFRYLDDTLLIPITDAKSGKIISLQGILTEQDGRTQKRYLKNARKQGGCHMIGSPPAAGEPLAFCEGYATGATIHELTGWAVVVAFDAANLVAVSGIMREQFTQAAFIICADNDPWSKAGDIENPGVHFAEKAAAATRGHLLIPKFVDTASKPSDFNDLAALEGDTMARAQLLANPVTGRPSTSAADLPAKAAPANDNVDYATPLPDLGRGGKHLPTIENLAEVCARLGVTVRYNVIAKSQELLIPGESFTLDNQGGASLARLESECARFGMPTEKLSGFLTYLADRTPYNPVAQWITSQPWDGHARFPDLVATVQTRPTFDRGLWALLLRRWLISAVAAAVKPSGFWSKGVLVFQGAQSLGKTAWFRALLSEELRGLVKVDATINPDNKDSIISAVSHWLVELGELDGTLRKADIARLKGFISQDVDQFRRPYARAEEKFQRRTVFFASVNPEQFLADDTGNVRWWTVPVEGLHYEHGIDMQQLWAEVLQWYEAGEQWWLTAGEEARLEAGNAHHEQTDPVEEIILARYGSRGSERTHQPMTATQLLLAIGFDKPTKAQKNVAAKIMRRLFGDPRRTMNGLFFEVPAGEPDRPF